MKEQIQQPHYNPPVLHIHRSTNIFTDIRDYFIHKPQIKTLVKFNTEDDRRLYSESIMQRVGMDVNSFRLLNIHRIGIEVPASILFDDLMKWNGDSICWPNHIARVNLVNGRLENILISLFGKSKSKGKKGLGAIFSGFPQLFELEAIRIQTTPSPVDADNARYLLYRCSGGYPIGIFSMYVRTSIPERGESAMSQLFIMVSFNFYGNKTLTRVSLINRLWETIHNRVTSNVANRFKILCEWKFEYLKEPEP